MSAIANPANPDNQQKFELRCWSLALRWWQMAMEFEDPPRELFLEAVDTCHVIAAELELTDADAVQRVIARAFAPYREELDGWVP